MDYESLTLANDFIFSKVMADKSLCKHLLEIILKIKIRNIVYHSEQQVLADCPDAKAIRMDVYVEDEYNTVFDIEMQTTNTGELPKRSRYYQGAIDNSLLDKGVDISYNDLKDTYIIFICLEDIFGKGRTVYRFENLCVDDPTIALNDRTVKIFLNANSEMNDIDKELSNFLLYLKTGETNDDFTRDLEESVVMARKNKDWKKEYRMIEMRDRLNREQGIRIGREQERIENIATFLSRGGTEEQARNLLDASDEEIASAKASLVK